MEFAVLAASTASAAAAAAAAAAASDSTSGHRRRRPRSRPRSVLACSPNRPPDHTGAHLRLQSVDSPASRPHPPPLQSPTVPHAWSSGISIAGAASFAAAAAADVSHLLPSSCAVEPGVPIEHLSLVRMTDFICWTFIVRTAFRVLELEIEAAKVIGKKHEFLVGQKVVEADGQTMEYLTDMKHQNVYNQVAKKTTQIRLLEESLRETRIGRDKAVQDLARLKKRQTNDLEKFRSEFLSRIADIEKKLCTSTQENISEKTDPGPKFEALTSLKKMFAKIGGVLDDETPGFKIESETIAMIGVIVALATFQSGFTIPALISHAKTELPKDSYDAIKKAALYCVVSMFGVENRKSKAKKPSMLVVFMDGESVGHPIEMRACTDYKSLGSVIEGLFQEIGTGLIDGTSKYELLCENKDDFLLRVGGISWETFISNDIKRLIVKKKPMEGVGIDKVEKSSTVLAELIRLKESVIAVGNINVFSEAANKSDLDVDVSVLDIKDKYKGATLSPKWKAFKTVIFRDRDDNLQDSKKIAAFDFDGCLADTSIPRTGPDAWSLMYPSIPERLQGLHDDGYKLVIFTNESNIERWKNKRQQAVDSKIGQFNNFINTVKVPIQVFLACGLGKSKHHTDDPFRKPKPGMWRLMERNFNSGIAINMEESFYVGVAAGRGNDHSDADIIFAKEIGLKFHHPEDFFGATEVSQS